MNHLPPAEYFDAERLNGLAAAFEAKYKVRPDAVIRVPGRVNLIGEHIDYCGYGVHPMAIQQDTLVAVKTSNEGQQKIVLSNVNGGLYQDQEVDISGGRDQLVVAHGGDGEKPKWWNYFLCGVKGVLEEKPEVVSPKGFSALVDGKIPPSAGLSSSSALVVAAALCTLWTNGLKMELDDLATLCARSERYIGTQGGGMDQAIEILAKKGSAKLIEFNPLRTTDVTLPKGAKFVIANSTSQCNKADVGGGSKFNVRVVECRMAAKILGKTMQLENWRSISKLGDLQAAAKKSIWEMMSVVKETLHQQPYTKDEVVQILGLEATGSEGHRELEELVSMPDESVKAVASFDLFKRAFHVYSEAKRVYDFKMVCDKANDVTNADDVTGGNTAALKKLGKLMYESHESCAKLYDCSHPNLDELVELSNQYGALGARLTGAGWGGCIVALVPQESVRDYIKGLKTSYYTKINSVLCRDFEAMDQLIFPTEPGSGAQIFKL